MCWVSFTDLLPCADRTSSKKRPKVPGINCRFSYFHPQDKIQLSSRSETRRQWQWLWKFWRWLWKRLNLTEGKQAKEGGGGDGSRKGGDGEVAATQIYIFNFYFNFYILYLQEGGLLNQNNYFHFYWHLYISYLKGKRWGCLSTIYTVNFPFIFKLPLENTLQSGAILETLIGVRWKERKARELMSSEASKSTCWRSYR